MGGSWFRRHLAGCLFAAVILSGCSGSDSPDNPDPIDPTVQMVEAGGASPWSPNGEQIARAGPADKIEIVDDEGSVERSFDSELLWAITWIDDQHLLYLNKENLEPKAWAVEAIESDDEGEDLDVVEVGPPIDEGTWAPRGWPLAFVTNSSRFRGENPIQPGRAIWVKDGPEEKARLLADLRGNERGLTISPDGKKLAATSAGRLWIMELDGSRRTRVGPNLIVHGGPNAYGDPAAAWSPDGRSLAVAIGPGRNQGLHLASVGGQLLRRLFDKGVGSSTPAWTPDGRSITIYSQGRVQTLDRPSGDATTVARFEAADVFDLVWSPDGDRLAYSSVSRLSP